MRLKTELFDYQKEAAEKLLPIRIGALYMEMGTGKTRTALEMIQKRFEKGKVSKVLWMCPVSVKKNLTGDLDKHADGWRDLIRIEGLESLSQSDRLYLDLVQQVFDMVIVDESNLVKNCRAKRTARICEIGKNARYRLILNGTPVSRNEADLYAQWYFLDQRVFGYRTFWSFAANHLEYDQYGKIRRVLNTGYLTDKIAPYAVSVRKNDVLKLPEKNTYWSTFFLNSDQLDHYCSVRDRLLIYVDEYDSTTIYRLFTALQLVTSGKYVQVDDRGRVTSKPWFSDPHQNPRIQQLMSVLPDKDKTIIWIKFIHEAEDIRSVLPEGSYATFTGEITVKKRMEELERFKTDSACMYLIANKVCGGYGLNLQFCHQMIFYDNDWNYGTRAQAEDRTHRLGQDHEVSITDIAAYNCIDERICSCLDRKENLADEIKRQIKEKRSLKEWLGGENAKEISEQKRAGSSTGTNRIPV